MKKLQSTGFITVHSAVDSKDCAPKVSSTRFSVHYSRRWQYSAVGGFPSAECGQYRFEGSTLKSGQCRRIHHWNTNCIHGKLNYEFSDRLVLFNSCNLHSWVRLG